MKKLCLILILCIIGVSLTITGLTADETLVWKPEWPTKIRIGAASIGGGFYMSASSMANALLEEFPELEVIVEQTKASIHNIKLLEADEVEFAMNTNETLYESRMGRGPFDGEKYTKARIFMPVEISPQEYVSLKKENITDITQFTGQFSGMTKGGQIDSSTRKLFSFFNIKAPIVNLSPDDTVQALKVGSVQGYCLGFPNTTTEQLALTHDIRMIGLTKEQGEAFIKEYPEYLYPLTIPGGKYKGIDEPVETIGIYCILIVREDMPEDMVYTALRAIYKHKDTVAATWPSFGKDMQNLGSVKYLNLPFHKGSIKYYKEIGVELSEEATSLNE